MNDRFALLRVDDDEVWRVLSLDVGADRDRTKTSVAMLLTAKRAGVLGIEIYDQLVEQGAPVNLVNGLAWTFFTMGLSGPFSELLQKQGTRSKTAAANGARRSLFTGAQWEIVDRRIAYWLAKGLKQTAAANRVHGELMQLRGDDQ